MTKKQIIPALSVITGILLVLGGVTLLISYINKAVESFGQADSSLVFWHIPILFLGLMLSVAGAFFITISFKARTEPALYRLSGNSLLVLPFVLILAATLVWIGEFRADQARANHQEQQRILSEIMDIQKVEIRNLTTQSFTLYLLTEGEQTGEYEMTVKVFDSQDELYEISELHLMNSPGYEITTEHTFDNIFEACADSNSKNLSYFCVDNAGTNSAELKISVTLKPRSLEKIELLPDDVETSWTTSLVLDTKTQNGLVNIETIKQKYDPKSPL